MTIFEAAEEVVVGEVAVVEYGRVTEGVHEPLRNSIISSQKNSLVNKMIDSFLKQ